MDPLVGGRITGILTAKAEVTLGGGVGDWGVGSQMNYQIFGILGYRIKPALALKAGYRYLCFGRRRGSGTYLDVATSGVLFGVSIILKEAKRFLKYSGCSGGGEFTLLQTAPTFSVEAQVVGRSSRARHHSSTEEL